LRSVRPPLVGVAAGANSREQAVAPDLNRGVLDVQAGRMPTAAAKWPSWRWWSEMG